MTIELFATPVPNPKVLLNGVWQHNLKNTESLRFWSFSTRNDRKKILTILKGDIDCSKKNTTFWIWGFLVLGIFEFMKLRKLRFINLSFVQLYFQNKTSSNIEFCMKHAPIRFNFQLSTTFRRGVQSWKTEKMSVLFPKMAYPKKVIYDVRSYETYDSSIFICFKILKNKFIEKRMLHEKWPLTL